MLRLIGSRYRGTSLYSSDIDLEWVIEVKFKIKIGPLIRCLLKRLNLKDIKVSLPSVEFNRGRFKIEIVPTLLWKNKTYVHNGKRWIESNPGWGLERMNRLPLVYCWIKTIKTLLLNTNIPSFMIEIACLEGIELGKTFQHILEDIKVFLLLREKPHPVTGENILKEVPLDRIRNAIERLDRYITY